MGQKHKFKRVYDVIDVVDGEASTKVNNVEFYGEIKDKKFDTNVKDFVYKFELIFNEVYTREEYDKYKNVYEEGDYVRFRKTDGSEDEGYIFKKNRTLYNVKLEKTTKIINDFDYSNIVPFENKDGLLTFVKFNKETDKYERYIVKGETSIATDIILDDGTTIIRNVEVQKRVPKKFLGYEYTYMRVQAKDVIPIEQSLDDSMSRKLLNRLMPSFLKDKDAIDLEREKWEKNLIERATSNLKKVIKEAKFNRLKESRRDTKKLSQETSPLYTISVNRTTDQIQDTKIASVEPNFDVQNFVASLVPLYQNLKYSPPEEFNDPEVGDEVENIEIFSSNYNAMVKDVSVLNYVVKPVRYVVAADYYDFKSEPMPDNTGVITVNGNFKYLVLKHLKNNIYNNDSMDSRLRTRLDNDFKKISYLIDNNLNDWEAGPLYKEIKRTLIENERRSDDYETLNILFDTFSRTSDDDIELNIKGENVLKYTREGETKDYEDGDEFNFGDVLKLSKDFFKSETLVKVVKINKIYKLSVVVDRGIKTRFIRKVVTEERKEDTETKIEGQTYDVIYENKKYKGVLFEENETEYKYFIDVRKNEVIF